MNIQGARRLPFPLAVAGLDERRRDNGELAAVGRRDRAQRLYYRRRVRVNGKRKALLTRLPAFDDPSFAEEYEAAKADRPAPPKAIPGSFGALAIDFRAAIPKMRNKRGKPLAPATVANYAMYVDRIETDLGKRLVKQMRKAHVYKIRDRLANTPGTANNYLAVLRRMLEFACERDWIAANPAAGVPALALGEHKPWPACVLEAAIESATKMTRLAIVVGLCTGQRVGDVIGIQHGHRRNGIVEVASQNKTGVAAAIPEHPLMTAEIARIERRAITILYDRFGKPFVDVEPIQARIRDLMAMPAVKAAIAEAGEAGECEPDATFTFHGLRKNACCYLLELGLSDAAVGGMLGMSPDMVRHYGKRRRAYMIAQGAVETVTTGTIVALGATSGPKSGQRAAGGGEKA